MKRDHRRLEGLPPVGIVGLLTALACSLLFATSAIPAASGTSLATQPSISRCHVASNVGRASDNVSMVAFRSGTWYVRGSITSGPADLCFVFGQPGDQPVSGDWDGNGTITPGVFRPSTGTWYLSNAPFAQSGANIVVRYGSPGDIAYPGDWDRSGTTSVGVYRPTTHQFLLSNRNISGMAEGVFPLGNPGDIATPISAAGDLGDVLMLYRPSTSAWYTKQIGDPSGHVYVETYGRPGDLPLAGPWGLAACGVLHCTSGTDTTPGVYRPSTHQWLLGYLNAPVRFGNPGDIRLGLGQSSHVQH